MYNNLGADLIDVMAGGHIDTGTTEWLQERSNALRSTLSGAAASFVESARSMYTMISTTDAAQILRNLTAKATSLWSPVQIAPLLTLPQLQTANPIMQRWVMACPEVRTRYLNQELEGYGDSYTNYHRDAIGPAHYDWRRVMDGIVVVNEKDWGYTSYVDLMGEGEEPLSVHQKVDILKTWNAVRHYLEEGDEDPTSTCGAKL